MSRSSEEMENDREWEERLVSMAQALSREHEPSRMLEERTVSALRTRGILQSRRPQRFNSGWMAGGVAASIALFAMGVVFGQWLGTRHTAAVVSAVQQNDAAQAALQVQRAGSEYVGALQTMARFADAGNREVSLQGREVALTALYAAANEVVRLAPNDPIAAEILRGFQSVRQQQAVKQNIAPERRIVWF
jgi:hypothetical protein